MLKCDVCSGLRTVTIVFWLELAEQNIFPNSMTNYQFNDQKHQVNANDFSFIY